MSNSLFPLLSKHTNGLSVVVMGDGGSAADSSESWTNDGTTTGLVLLATSAALSEILRLAALELVDLRTAQVGTPVHPTVN